MNWLGGLKCGYPDRLEVPDHHSGRADDTTGAPSIPIAVLLNWQAGLKKWPRAACRFTDFLINAGLLLYRRRYFHKSR